MVEQPKSNVREHAENVIARKLKAIQDYTEAVARLKREVKRMQKAIDAGLYDLD